MLLNPYRFAPASAAADPYWSNVGLYLRFNGANGSTSFTDEKGNAITRNGSAVISTTDGFGGACGDFPAGAYLSAGLIPGISGLTASTAWSIEVRVKITWSKNRTAGLVSYSPTTGGDDLRFHLEHYNSASYVYITAEGSATCWYGTYTHINGQFMTFQASCDGTTIRVFVDGVAVTLTPFDYSDRASHQAGLLVGTIANIATSLTNLSITGQLDELRITKGVARNTAPYTPATGQFPNY